MRKSVTADAILLTLLLQQICLSNSLSHSVTARLATVPSRHTFVQTFLSDPGAYILKADKLAEPTFQPKNIGGKIVYTATTKFCTKCA